MKKIAITIVALFVAALSFGQTIEKSQAEMIYDVVPSVAPCVYCSEMIFVMADTSEYRWDGNSWELWDNGVRWSLEQDSIRVGYKLGIEYARDTIRTPGSGGGGGATNLAYTASATDGTVTSDTGTDATIPAGSTTNASLMLPADKTKLDGIESGATADQNSSEVELSAPITGLPASTDVHEALTELATNATVADQLIGDLITLSGVPITSQDLGTFTGTTITDGNTIKGALQELETSLEVKMDSFTLVMAADTSYYIFTQYNTSSGAFQVDTLWQRVVSGGGGDDQTAEEVPVTNTNLKITPNVTNLQQLAEAVDTALLKARGTEIFSGGVVTLTTDSTTFSVTETIGQIKTATGYFSIIFPGATDVAISSIASQSTWIYIDSTNTLKQTTSAPQVSDFANRLYLWRIASNGTKGIASEEVKNPGGQYTNQIRTLSEYVNLQHKGINLSGNPNLTFATASGSVFEFGGNFSNDIQSPNVVDVIGSDTVQFFLLKRDATVSPSEITVPQTWDNAGVVTALTSNRYVIHTIHFYTSGNYTLQLGQNQYTSLDAAREGISSRSFTPNPATVNGQLIGWIITKEGTTDLTDDAENDFIDNIGGLGGGVSSVSGALYASNNLSDVDDPAAALANIGGIGGTITDNQLPKYDSVLGELVDSGLADNDTTLTVDRHIKQQRTYYPSTLRTTTAGSDTIIIVNTGIQRLCPSVTFVYVRLSYFDQQTTTLAQQGTIGCRIRIDNAGATPQDGYIQVMGDWNVTLEGKVGYDNTTDEAVISFRGPNARYIVERIDFTTDAADFNPDNISITGVSTETGYTLSSAEMTNRAFVIGAQAEDQEFDGNVVGLAISNSNTGGTNNSVSFHMIASHGPDASGQDLTRGVKLVAHKNSTGATNGHDLAIELPTASDSDNPVERFRFQAEGQLGIQTTTPAYTLDLGASNAGLRLNPHNTALTGAEGLLFWHNADNTLNGHNGTNFFRFMQQSDVLPTNGQVGVFNSTTGLYEPTTLTTGTMSSFNIESNDFTFYTIADDDNVSLLGDNGISTSDGVLPGQFNFELDLETIPNNTTVDGEESLLYFDELDGVEYKVDIDFIKDYINSGVATSSIYTGSDTIPDFTSAKTALGAGLEFADDNFSLTGDVFFPDVITESVHTVLGLSSTNKLVEYTPQDTIFIPIYAHPHDEAITTGSADYRGWRVPADLNGAKIEAIQYSFDTPGSDTVTIQLTNGTINVAGATIPALGYVENTAVSQTLTTGEKWTPTIGTINGTGHEGLMVNLMIVR